MQYFLSARRRSTRFGEPILATVLGFLSFHMYKIQTHKHSKSRNQKKKEKEKEKNSKADATAFPI